MELSESLSHVERPIHLPSFLCVFLTFAFAFVNFLFAKSAIRCFFLLILIPEILIGQRCCLAILVQIERCS